MYHIIVRCSRLAYADKNKSPVIDLLMKFETESGYLSLSPPPSLSALPNSEISFLPLSQLSLQKYRWTKTKFKKKKYTMFDE